MCGPLEHAQPPYFYPQLPCVSVCVNDHNKGNCKKEDLCCLRHVDLYASQGNDLGEGGSLSYWHYTVKVIGLGCMVIVKQSQKLSNMLLDHYIKTLQFTVYSHSALACA